MNRGLGVAYPVAHLEFEHFLFASVVELEGAVQSVGRLLIVVEHEMAANRADLGRELHAQAPARDIHLMNALVPEIAVAGIPEPVPVVMETVLRERTLRGRAGPEIVIHARRHLRNRSAA